jgi:transposase InsO family protein
MQREWAKGLRYRNSTTRNRALPHWLRHYHERRPHSSLGGHPSKQARSQPLKAGHLARKRAR